MMTIKILGISDSTEVLKLRANVIQALEELGTKAIVEQVGDLNLFLRYKINGIPALIVNDMVVLQKVVPSVEELKVVLRVLERSTINHFIMKKLLVPVDFSVTSADALKFALAIAEKEESVVKVIYVCHPEYDPQNPYMTPPLNVLQEVALQKLEALIDSAKPASNTKVEKEVIIGFPVEEIIRVACEGTADLIIMGTKGEKGFLEKMFGSVSIHVARKAECPVLLIPEGVCFEGFRHILYASNFESIQESAIRQISELASKYHADIHFVHVAEEENKTYQEIESHLFKMLFKGGEPSFSFTMSRVEGRSVVEGLNDYAVRHQVDLLALATPHRPFWENIFHKSITKAVMFHTRLPILVLRA